MQDIDLSGPADEEPALGRGRILQELIGLDAPKERQLAATAGAVQIFKERGSQKGYAGRSACYFAGCLHAHDALVHSMGCMRIASSHSPYTFTVYRLLRQLLSHLHQWEVLSGSALETWRYNTSDVTAVKDVSTWLDELKEQEDNEDRSP